MTAVYALPSPLGTLTLAADGDALTGLWMEGQKYFRAGIPADAAELDLPVFSRAEAYLKAYFSGAPCRRGRLCAQRAPLFSGRYGRC